MKYALLFLALCGLLPACNKNAAESKPIIEVEGAKLSVKDEVCLVVLTKIFQERRLNESAGAFVNFVAIEKNDPSRDLLSELNRSWTDLHPDSESEIDTKMGQGQRVKEKNTNKDGIRYEIREIKMVGGDAEITAGYHKSSLDADECKYKLHHENGEWTIVAISDCWVA